MKNFISHMRFRMVLPLLFLGVLLTLPTASTGSKYVWNDTIDITLQVVIQDSAGTQSINSHRIAAYPWDDWAKELENMEAEATKEGLVLTAEASCTLPESITVSIGQASFLVYTDGTQPQEGITFDGERGLLSISESLIAENPGGVTVTAAAVRNAIPEEEIHEPIGDTQPPSDDNTAGEESTDETVAVSQEEPSL